MEQVNIYVHFWMLEASFLSFDNAEVQFSMGFSAQKSPKPNQNSWNAEISCIDSLEYMFDIPDLV